MNRSTRQQIAISGVGGQGVLFVTKVLAETALANGWSVLISETHGMAQRGGNVISHLKISRKADPAASAVDPTGSNPADPGPGEFCSPLIRSGQADVLICLHPDGVPAHGHFKKTDGILFSNEPTDQGEYVLDATGIAGELGSPISANLVLIGFAAGSGRLFCTTKQVRQTIEDLGGPRLEINLRAFLAGVNRHA